MIERNDCHRLRLRELGSSCWRSYPTGYSKSNIANLSIVSDKIEHRGCINTAEWSRDGSILATGSDDRTIKLWNTAGSFENIKLISTLSKILLFL